MSLNDIPTESSYSRSENADKYDDIGKGTLHRAPDKEGVDEMFTELQNLRKKFDAVVEYTVHLTADRDNIVAQLTDTKKELTVLKSSSETTAGGKAASRAYEADKRMGGLADARKATKGFSLFFVILIAFIAYIFGRFFA